MTRWGGARNDKGGVLGCQILRCAQNDKGALGTTWGLSLVRIRYQGLPIKAMAFLRTSASSEGETLPLNVALRFVQSRLFT